MSRNKVFHPQRGAAASKLIPALIIVAIGGGGALWYLSQEKPEAVVPQPAPVATLPAPAPEPDPIEAAPDIPQMPVLEEVAPVDDEPAPPSIPVLAESDDYVRATWQTLSDNEQFSGWLGTDSLMQKAVAVIDGFAKGSVARKILPFQSPKEPFKVSREADRIYLDDANFERYSDFIDLITAVPPEAVANSFHQLRPLFEESYDELGYSGEKVDNALIAAIDQMLATPEVTGPIALKQPAVMYQFADPELEALPAVQKQIIRMGPQNREKLLTYLGRLRASLLEENASDE